MSFPILYEPTETTFDHNGCGILSDCISCIVIEERNGMFELELRYPFDGIHYNEIKDRSIIKAKPNQITEPQLFRVYAKSKPMSGEVIINAQHISYDLSGIPVSPFTANDAFNAMYGLRNNAVIDCPFTFSTDKTTEAEFSVKKPCSIRNALGGMEGSILDTFGGGEFEFDNFRVVLHNERGLNRGVSIRYGKNLTDIQQDENCAAVFTGVYPYWSDLEGKELVTLDEKIVNIDGNFSFRRIKTVDLSSSFEFKPTKEQLLEETNKYIEEYELGKPIVSLTVSFEQLAQSEEYKNSALLERVLLCDTVNVEFPALGVSSTAQAVRIAYDVLQNRVLSVTLGSIRTNLADTIENQKKEIAKKPDKTFMQIAIETLTNSLLGANGGSVRFLDTNEDKIPDTLYIADNENPALATKVWRFNYEGWGASKNGYAGPFIMGATFDSGIVAEFITAGTLYGMLLKAGAIESVDGKIRIDLDDTSKTAYFDAGLRSNMLEVASPSTNKQLFVARELQSNYDEPFLELAGYGNDGRQIMRLTEMFDTSGNSLGVAFSVQGMGNECYVSTDSDYESSSQTLKSQNTRLGLVADRYRSEISFGNTLETFSIGLGTSEGAYVYFPGIGKLLLKAKENDDGTLSFVGEYPTS